jgi:ribose 5-phosphate isomerase B
MLVIASDHGGFALKQELMEHLRARGVEFEDIGTYSEESCDYPVYAEKAARGVAEGKYEKGILVCGTGIGMSLAANKIKGIRCAVLSDCFSAEMCRAHNDANMIALGGRVIGGELAKRMVDLFLDTPFMGGRHARRVDLIRALEEK